VVTGIVIIIIILRANAETRHKSTINNKERLAATMYPLGTLYASGICVYIPCIKETMMMMMTIIIIIIIIITII